MLPRINVVTRQQSQAHSSHYPDTILNCIRLTLGSIFSLRIPNASIFETKEVVEKVIKSLDIDDKFAALVESKQTLILY